MAKRKPTPKPPAAIRPEDTETPPETRPEEAKSATRCKRCNSTDCTPTSPPRTLKLPGRLPDGRIYHAVTWQHVRCDNCRQVRTDRRYN